MSDSGTRQTTVISAAVRPLRFTAHLPAMRAFLEVLGFSARVSRREDWVVMVGAAGMVSLHSTVTVSTGGVSGETGLCFETTDIDALALRFAEAGLETEVYDEAWGRAMTVRTTNGVQFTFDEEPTDLYGYDVDEPQPRHGIVAMPVRFDRPGRQAAESVLEVLGYEVSGDEWWQLWVSNTGGSVALGGTADGAEEMADQLGFRTSEPLGDLAERLMAAGFEDVTVSPQYGGELTVTDPDGQEVLVVPVLPTPTSEASAAAK